MDINLNRNLLEEISFPHRATLRNFFVSIVALSFLTMFVPFCFREHSIYTTKIIFVVTLIPFFISRIIDLITDHHTKIIDWILTALILLIGAPVSIACGVVGVFVILIYPRSVYFVGWLVSTITIFMLGVRLTYDGKFPNCHKPFIVVANHSSFLDYFLIVHVMGYKPWTVVYGKNLHKYWIIKFFTKRIGIGVERENKISRLSTSETMKESLSMGLRVAVFPEGTRMRSYQMDQFLLDFKNGPFAAASDCDAGIQPVVFDWPILFSKPDHPLPLSPRTIKITFLDFIEPVGKNRKNLSAEIHEKIEEKLH